MKFKKDNLAFFLEFCIFRNWYLESADIRTKILKGDTRLLEIHYQTRNLFFDDYLERLNSSEEWSGYAEFFLVYYRSTILDPAYAEKWKAVDERLIYQQLIELEKGGIKLETLAELDESTLFKTCIATYKKLFHPKRVSTAGLKRNVLLSVSVYLFIYAGIYMIKN